MSRLISYAQNAEDIVLWRALGRRDSPGTYVDIGANHPTGDSVTRLFYERGWRGVNVEPQPVLHRALVAERPEDVNLNVGVSDARGTLVLHLIPGADGLSTMNAELLEMYREQGRDIEDIEVPVLTLSEIVGEHVHGDVDFLKVDVEGHEREVLLGADWSAFRPRVIVIEATFPERWQGLLTEAAYEFAQYDGINNFYVRAEDVETLGPSLRQPATVMDYYDPWIYVDQLRAQASRIDALERELAESERRWHEASQPRVPDPELISGRDLARALVRRVVSRGRRLLTRRQ